MSDFINEARSKWTEQDILRSLLGFGFTSAAQLPGEEGNPKNLNLHIVHVEDSGEQYFCDGGKKFEGWRTLLRELTDVATGTEHIALRVSLGESSGPLSACGELDRRKLYGTPIEALAVRLVGKGVDGKPVLRLGVGNLLTLVSYLDSATS